MDARSRIFTYFERWRTKQLSPDPEDRCLVIKLSAEVADLSADMSIILQKLVSDILAHLAHTLEQGADDGTIALLEGPQASAEMLYHTWLGASLIASISHSDALSIPQWMPQGCLFQDPEF